MAIPPKDYFSETGFEQITTGKSLTVERPFRFRRALVAGKDSVVPHAGDPLPRLRHQAVTIGVAAQRQVDVNIRFAEFVGFAHLFMSVLYITRFRAQVH